MRYWHWLLRGAAPLLMNGGAARTLEGGAGEDVIIARNGTPVVRLAPVTLPKRCLGRWRNHVPTLSDAEWKASHRAVAELFDTALE